MPLISHRLIVARIFQIASFVIGMPSLGMGIFLSWMLTQAPPSPRPGAGPSGNQAVDLFVDAFRVAGSFLSFLGGLFEWFAILLIVIACLLVAYALVLFFVSRGIRAGRTFARIVGMLLALPPLLSSATTLVNLREPLPMLISLIVVGIAGYVVWGLGWKFDQGG